MSFIGTRKKKDTNKAIYTSQRHVQELYHLTLEERSCYIEELVHAAEAIEEVFQPLKMNFQFLGNAVPHLHCHIIPRFYGDAAPNSPLNPNTGTRLLSVQAYEERVNLIQAVLKTRNCISQQANGV